MDEFVDRAGVGLEVANELLVMAALLERREAELLVELRHFRHLADVECVRSQFVRRHQGFSFITSFISHNSGKSGTARLRTWTAAFLLQYPNDARERDK